MIGSDPEVIAVVRHWVQKADNDLKTAIHTLKLGENAPTDTVCFHIQQCVEKYLKALLVALGTEFSRTHHIGGLMELLPPPFRPDLTPEEQELLTDYAVTMRYPGDYEPVSLDEAMSSIRIAQRVRAQVRRHLPVGSLDIPQKHRGLNG